jgi:hypothetical protein
LEGVYGREERGPSPAGRADREEGEETSVDGGAVEGKILDTTKRTKREEREND